MYPGRSILLVARAMSMNRQLGFTLVELVITILVISISFVAMYSSIYGMMTASVDPMVVRQGIAISESIMDEVKQKKFSSGSCPAVPGSGNRSDYSYICHYNGLTLNGISDQQSNAISGLENYATTVITSNVDFSDAASSDFVKIVVSTSFNGNSVSRLVAFRANY